MRKTLITAALLVTTNLLSHFARGQIPEIQRPVAIEIVASCMGENRYFEEQVWAKVGERTCLKCHNSAGEARESDFVLTKPANDPAWCQRTHDVFAKMATTLDDNQSRLLLKASGGLDHGGGEVLKPDSSGYRILASFVRRLNKLDIPMPDPPAESISREEEKYLMPPFFDSVSMISPPQLLRRATLSLCGRLPTSEETSQVAQAGSTGLNAILDGVMKEEAFYDRAIAC